MKYTRARQLFIKLSSIKFHQNHITIFKLFYKQGWTDRTNLIGPQQGGTRTKLLWWVTSTLEVASITGGFGFFINLLWRRVYFIFWYTRLDYTLLYSCIQYIISRICACTTTNATQWTCGFLVQYSYLIPTYAR